MIYVGIDVAKDKHDCCILDEEVRKLYPVFTSQMTKSVLMSFSPESKK